MIYFPFYSMTFCHLSGNFMIHAHRTSGLDRQKTEPSAILQLHHHWKFYHSRSSAKIEIISNLMVQGQGYIVDVSSLPNQALIIFGEWLKMCCAVVLRGENLDLYNWPILADFLWSLYWICSTDDSSHSN